LTPGAAEDAPTSFPEVEAAAQEALQRHDVDQAVALYDSYLEDHPLIGSESFRALAALVDIARTYQTPTEVLAVCDRAWDHFGANQAYLPLFAWRKVEALLALKQPAEAEAFAREQWTWLAPMPCWEGYRSGFLQRYYQALWRQGKREEAIALLVGVLTSRLAELTQGGVYDRLIEGLLELKDYDAALRWAKVNFQLCPYEAGAIQRAAENLSRVWLARDQGLKTLEAFIAFQKDPTQPNPLADMPRLELRAEQAEELLVNTGQIPAERISVFLLRGEWEAALAEARAAFTASGGSKEAVEDICRCFKAKDLHLQRAHQWVRYVQGEVVEDPLVDF